jgi:hypothetical protein
LWSERMPLFLLLAGEKKDAATLHLIRTPF